LDRCSPKDFLSFLKNCSVEKPVHSKKGKTSSVQKKKVLEKRMKSMPMGVFTGWETAIWVYYASLSGKNTLTRLFPRVFTLGCDPCFHRDKHLALSGQALYPEGVEYASPGSAKRHPG
jgi:hypothetical protein